MEWEKRVIDANFLIDSGLVFEINRTILHLVGLALTVEDNKLTLLDRRNTPEYKFNKEVYTMGEEKLKRFMTEFGNKQMEKRRKKLGYGYQTYSAK